MNKTLFQNVHCLIFSSKN